MAAILPLTAFRSTSVYPVSSNSSPLLKSPLHINFQPRKLAISSSSGNRIQQHFLLNFSKTEAEPEDDEFEHTTGVKAALSMLYFYKREISPLLPKSCRYVPSCSEYSMIAFKKYGVTKGTILTAWRLCRCNPLGGSGFDPPRWFGEERVSDGDD